MLSISEMCINLRRVLRQVMHEMVPGSQVIWYANLPHRHHCTLNYDISNPFACYTTKAHEVLQRAHVSNPAMLTLSFAGIPAEAVFWRCKSCLACQAFSDTSLSPQIGIYAVCMNRSLAPWPPDDSIPFQYLPWSSDRQVL